MPVVKIIIIIVVVVVVVVITNFIIFIIKPDVLADFHALHKLL